MELIQRLQTSFGGLGIRGQSYSQCDCKEQVLKISPLWGYESSLDWCFQLSRPQLPMSSLGIRTGLIHQIHFEYGTLLRDSDHLATFKNLQFFE